MNERRAGIVLRILVWLAIGLGAGALVFLFVPPARAQEACASSYTMEDFVEDTVTHGAEILDIVAVRGRGFDAIVIWVRGGDGMIFWHLVRGVCVLTLPRPIGLLDRGHPA